MEEQTISALQKKPPLYWEAVAYCRDCGLPPEEVERARVMLAHRELRRVTEPYTQQMARLIGVQPCNWIVSEGMVRANLSRETDAALKQLQELIDIEAERLGLTET